MNDQEISKRALAIGGYTKWVRTGVFFFAPFWAAFTIATLFGLGTLIATAVDVLSDASNKDYATNIRWHALAFAAMLAAFGGLISAPFAIVRVYVAERQTRATEAQKDTAEQGLITDRFTKAVEQLGAEKTVKRIVEGKPQEWTEPNLEVRLGGIYALARIAQDSKQYQLAILQILAAYIRQNANAGNEAAEFEQGSWANVHDTSPQAYLMEKLQWIDSLAPLHSPRDDIKAAFGLVESGLSSRPRSSPETETLFKANLSEANFQRLVLAEAILPDMIARLAHLEGAVLNAANLKGADLSYAFMDGVILKDARLNGAILTSTKMELADLRLAKLISAHLEDWACRGANCRGTDFSEATNMTQAQANAIFGDRSTTLPDPLLPPDHWSDETLSDAWLPDPEYENWVSRGAPPGKPAEA